MKAGNAVILSVVLAAVILGAYIYIGPALQELLQPEVPVEPEAIVECDSSTVCNVTFPCTDFYNKGTTVNAYGMQREEGLAAWTNMHTRGGFLSGSPFTDYEIVYCTNTTDPANQCYGPYLTNTQIYTVPCRVTASVVYPNNGAIYVRNVATLADITANSFDEYGDRITGTTTLDLDAGDEITAKIQITGDFENDYGSVFCGENSNILVAHYNSSMMDDIKITELGSPINVPDNVKTETGWKNKAWNFPVLQSSTSYVYNVFYNADNTLDPTGCDNDTATGWCGTDPSFGNATQSQRNDIFWYVFDSHHYLNSLTNVIECGVEDEDNNIIGRLVPLVFYSNITADV